MTERPPVAIQLYTLRDQAAEHGLRAVLEQVAGAGYRGVETAGFHDLSPDEFARICADLDLQLASAHIGLGTPAETAATLDLHADAGFDTVVVPFLAPDAFRDEASVRSAADQVSMAAGLAAERGLSLGYHNHFWELADLRGRPALLAFFDLVDPRVFAEVDIYWAQVGGADPAELLSTLGGRVRILHVKDGPADSPQSAMVAVGDGAVDVPAAIAAAPTAQWHCVELDRCDTDMCAAVARSLRYLIDNSLSGGATR